MKKNLWLFGAYILAIAAILLSLWRCKPFEFDSVVALASILSLLVAILLGIIACNYFIQKGEADKFKQEAEQFKKEAEQFKQEALELIKNEREERNKQFITLQEKVNSFGLEVVDNPEYIYAITDVSDHFLFGIKREDGAIDWQVGIPKPIRDELEALKKRIAELEKK